MSTPSNVVSLEAYRAAIFRGSREEPVYDPSDLPRFPGSRYSPAEIEAWINQLCLDDDGGSAA